MSELRNITGPIAYHAEGPIWSPTWGGLRWVDMFAGDLLTFTDDGITRRHVGRLAAFVRPRASGGFVVGLWHQLAVTDADDGELRLLPPMWADEDTRFNECGVSPNGTLYAGSMHLEQAEGAGRLYRIGADGTIETTDPAVTVSNGLGFTPNGELAYYADTPTGRIDVFDNVEDRLVNRRPFVEVDGGDGPGSGRPDGLCVDAEGAVWVAVNGSGQVHRYDAEGTLTQRIEVPVSQPTACTLGGDDLRTLYITTSREGLPDDAEPDAGSVYATRVGIPGLPVEAVAH
ncbi:gluconolactonase [Tersicoccus solisilvae]|uniref:Gluconolactonase n=1 Tax=Tersicoccus solisilvae TaxID=1882339 RepID=A0ABQ1NTL8_9MICC|nr:SMP-30/gluconolactonase/LRE family protein [Tersicoccus solisilvae]GGC84998.1 gluconolactonase [Tersicoccus solisilvae]